MAEHPHGEIPSFHVRETEVNESTVKGLSLGKAQGFPAIEGGSDAVIFFLQYFFQRGTDDRLVINNEYIKSRSHVLLFDISAVFLYPWAASFMANR